MKDIAIAIVFAITGWMLSTWLSHRERMKELSMKKQGLGTSDQRLERVEAAVEAIAIEVERIGEGQRYVTSLLSERSPQALEGAGEAVRRVESPR
jgi:hypothetical protein